MPLSLIFMVLFLFLTILFLFAIRFSPKLLLTTLFLLLWFCILPKLSYDLETFIASIPVLLTATSRPLKAQSVLLIKVAALSFLFWFPLLSFIVFPFVLLRCFWFL